MREGLVPPVKGAPGEQLVDLVGGYVKDPVLGMHEWIVSFDLDSLYPHLIMQYNMSPETFLSMAREYVSQDMVLEGRYKNNTSFAVCANGACFTKDFLGVIPEIIEELSAADMQEYITRVAIPLQPRISAGPDPAAWES